MTEEGRRKQDGGIIGVRPVRAHYIRGHAMGWAWGVLVDLQPVGDDCAMTLERVASVTLATDRAVGLAKELFMRMHPHCEEFAIVAPDGADGVAMLVPPDECRCTTGNYN